MAESAQKVPSNTPEYTVSELSGAIRKTLEDGFGFVRLRGEISGYRGPHASGHCYFALKDDKSKIEAVVWRGVFGRLKLKPEEGMEVIATGKVSSFPGSSKYQIVIEAMEPAGLGALMAQLEERKRRLAAEGLFDEKRKRPIPFLPRVVGIVTSPTGAVIRDMLHGFAERFPARVVVWPVRVQGETSAAEVARAVSGFNRILPGGPVPRPDVIIVARGGGSLEDLWGFNDEAVVRAVAASALPVISAVGHETDWTLIDLAADARAPTPTKAAEWAVPKYSELLGETGDLSSRLRTAARRHLEAARAHLKAAARGLPRPEDLVALPRQRFDATERRLGRALLSNARAHHTRFVRVGARLSPRLVRERLGRASARLAETAERSRSALARRTALHRTRLARIDGRLRPETVMSRMEQKRRALDLQASLLRSLGYQSVLKRGFAIVRDGEGHMLRQAAGVGPGRTLDIEFADGHVAAETRAAGVVREAPRQDPAPPVRQQEASVRKGGPGQGSLF